MSELDMGSFFQFHRILRFASVPGPWLYYVPMELELLATRLGVSPEALGQMIEEGLIPLRVMLHKRKGLCVLIHEVFEGIARSGRLGEPKVNRRDCRPGGRAKHETGLPACTGSNNGVLPDR